MVRIRFGRNSRGFNPQGMCLDKILSIFLIIALVSITCLNILSLGVGNLGTTQGTTLETKPGATTGSRTISSSETEIKNEQLKIEYLNINTIIDNNYVTTNIEIKLNNQNNDSKDTTIRLQIPPKAFISNFSLTIDNITHYAEIVPKAVGKQQFDNAVKKGMNAGLIESMDKQIFTCSVNLKPKQVITVGLRYEQFLEKTLGGYEYRIPFSNSYFECIIDELSINITMRSQFNINKIEMKDYYSKTNITALPAKYACVTYFETNAKPNSDIIMTYELALPPTNGSMLNYHDGTNEFFFHIFSPQKSDLDGKAMPKDIIFVLDKSGSMYGNKIDQLKVAFKEVIKQLIVNDTFNVILFDNSITKYNNELIRVSSQNRTKAVNYIDNITAGGSTNINDALVTALNMFKAIEHTRMPIIVMLTDGLPTSGVTDTCTIRNNILLNNNINVSIFCLGFGFDVDFEFLKAMSLENNGFALRIYEDKDASLQITNFYDTISTPLLRSLNFSYSTGAYEVYPTYVEQLFEGSEIVIVGKYNGSSRNITASVKATSSGGPKNFIETFYLDESLKISFDSKIDGYGKKNNNSTNLSASPNSNLNIGMMKYNEIIKFRGPNNKTFIPRFWGYAKIMHLLDLITIHGENNSYVENVTKLAVKYGFVTPYTSLLVDLTEPGPGNDDTGSGSEGESEAEAECESEAEAEAEAEGESVNELVFKPDNLTLEADVNTEAKPVTEEIIVDDSVLHKQTEQDKDDALKGGNYVWAKIYITNENAFASRIYWLGIHFEWQAENIYYICSDISKKRSKELEVGQTSYFYIYMNIPDKIKNNTVHSYDILFKYELLDGWFDCWNDYFWLSEGNTEIVYVEENELFFNDPLEDTDELNNADQKDNDGSSDAKNGQTPIPLIPEDTKNSEEGLSGQTEFEPEIDLIDINPVTVIGTEPSLEIDMNGNELKDPSPESEDKDKIKTEIEKNENYLSLKFRMDYTIMSIVISLIVIISIIIIIKKNKIKTGAKSSK